MDDYWADDGNVFTVICSEVSEERDLEAEEQIGPEPPDTADDSPGPVGLRNPALRTNFRSPHSAYGFILDEVPYNILECIWNEKDRVFVVKAEYPGLPAYVKKFPFDQYLRVLSYWENFVFLFYHRLERRSAPDAKRMAQDHRRIVVKAWRNLHGKDAVDSEIGR